MQPAGNEAAREHCRNENPRVAQSGRCAHQDRARAETGESPSDAKDRRTRDQSRVERIGRRHVESAAAGGGRPLEDAPKRDGGDRDRAAHDEQQRGIERAEDVEESEHDESIGHAGNREAGAEQRTRRECRRKCELHGEKPGTWRITKTVAMPAAMNVTTAASERFEKRPSPQTPCPLVQPLPSRVPKPTRNPAASSREAGPVWNRGGGVGTNRSRTPPTIVIPPRNAMRQARSPGAAPATPLTMPLMPAMRPIDHSSRTAALPISTPPRRPVAQWFMRMVERVMGIEPTLAAWEAAVLPLNYTRGWPDFKASRGTLHFRDAGPPNPLIDHSTPLIATIVVGLGLAFLFWALASR